MDDLRELVKAAIQKPFTLTVELETFEQIRDSVDTIKADAAIRAVIEALATEAEQTRMITSDSRLDYDDYRVATGMQWNLEHWLRSHLSDPEKTHD